MVVVVDWLIDNVMTMGSLGSTWANARCTAPAEYITSLGANTLTVAVSGNNIHACPSHAALSRHSLSLLLLSLLIGFQLNSFLVQQNGGYRFYESCFWLREAALEITNCEGETPLDIAVDASKNMVNGPTHTIHTTSKLKERERKRERERSWQPTSLSFSLKELNLQKFSPQSVPPPTSHYKEEEEPFAAKMLFIGSSLSHTHIHLLLLLSVLPIAEEKKERKEKRGIMVDGGEVRIEKKNGNTNRSPQLRLLTNIQYRTPPQERTQESSAHTEVHYHNRYHRGIRHM